MNECLRFDGKPQCGTGESTALTWSEVMGRLRKRIDPGIGSLKEAEAE
jgi:hypothetical protein